MHPSRVGWHREACTPIWPVAADVPACACNGVRQVVPFEGLCATFIELQMYFRSAPQPLHKGTLSLKYSSLAGLHSV